MSNETKLDVFEKALTEWYEFIFEVGGQGNEAYGYSEFDATLSKYEKDYDDALPDDLPVIPKEVGEYIKDNEDLDLLVALTFANKGYKHSELWIAMHQNVFARAWVLGVWRVEETGEIVKLEAEK